MPADPRHPRPVDPTVSLAQRVAELDRRLRALEAFIQGGSTAQIPVVDVLPPPGRPRLLMLSSNGGVYADDGIAWRLIG